MASTVPPTLANGLQPLSCVRCAGHKVRCDRTVPCSRCHKSGAQCEFPTPKTEKRRRRAAISTSSSAASTSDEKLLSRLRLYENKLKSLGIDLDPIQSAEQPHPPLALGRDVLSLDATQCAAENRASASYDAPEKRCPYAQFEAPGSRSSTSSGVMRIGSTASATPSTPLTTSTNGVTDRGRVVVASSDHFTQYDVAASSGALVMGMLPGNDWGCQDIHTPQQHFAKLWQVYLQGIHPLTMVLHPDSSGPVLFETAKDPGRGTPGAEALLFAVMTAAAMSMTDEECSRTLATNLAAIVAEYKSRCRLALVRGEFLMSCNFVVLQALTVYLAAIAPDLDPRELWAMTGIAKRNAQRLSLRQNEHIPGHSPFHIEMRRRLWSQIALQDIMAAQSADPQWIGISNASELESPPSLNDSDLSPTMKRPTTERSGTTDMLFCFLRYKIAACVSEVNDWYRQWLAPRDGETDAVRQGCLGNRDSILQSMEKALELEILRYCDALSPLHVLTATFARSSFCKLRFTMLKVSQLGVDPDSNQAAEDRDAMLSTAIRVLEYESNMLRQPLIQGFLWYVHQGFLWPCLIHVLQWLQAHPDAKSSDVAWDQVRWLHELWLNHYYTPKNKVAIRTRDVIRSLTLQAWQQREICFVHHNRGGVLPTPGYITHIRNLEQQCFSLADVTPEFDVSQPSSWSSSQEQSADYDLSFATQGLDADIAAWSNWFSHEALYSNTEN